MKTKYEKGTFITVPNKHVLSTLDAQSQVLFVWICAYADDDGVCFPSIATLAKNVGASRRTIINRLAVLEGAGLISRTHRAKDNRKQTNLYQIMLVSSAGDAPLNGVSSARGAPGVVQEMHQGSAGDAHRTQSNELNPNELNKGEATAPRRYDPLGVEIIKAFEAINPACKKMYSNKTQRQACDDLIETFGLERTLNAIAYVAATRGQRYTPTITTPLQLWQGWASLEASAARNQSQTNVLTI